MVISTSLVQQEGHDFLGLVGSPCGKKPKILGAQPHVEINHQLLEVGHHNRIDANEIPAAEVIGELDELAQQNESIRARLKNTDQILEYRPQAEPFGALTHGKMVGVVPDHMDRSDAGIRLDASGP